MGASKRCCVFIDGENFRHGIINLFHDRFDKAGHLPGKAEWARFFAWLVEQACPGGELVRA